MEQKTNLKKTFFLIPFFVTVLCFFLFRLEIFQKFELVTYDLRMKRCQEKEPTKNVVIVFIGDETLKTLGKWPISRYWHAAITDVLKDYGAAIIAFDILFLEPSEDPLEDKAFGEAIKNAGNVILPYCFAGRLKKEGNFMKAEKVLLPALAENVKDMGFINIPADMDGITRRYPVVIEYDNQLRPSLGYSIIKHYLGLKEEEILKRIFVDRNSCAFVNFYHDLKKFPNYSFIQVLQSHLKMQKGENPTIQPDAFKNKIVLIGYTATGTSDIGPVSGFENYLKIGIHASFIENFLKGEFIRRVPSVINFIFPLLISFGLTAVIISTPALLAALFTFVIGCLFCFFGFWLFDAYHIWIDIVPVVFALVFTYLVITFLQFLQERHEKTKIKSIFQKYVSPAVMNEILANAEDIALGGEKKILTVMFADIKDFTPLSEKNPPEKTVEMLNTVLNVMVDAVFKYRGTLDKFIGDCVMAIFGAPVEEKNHAKNAVMAAIEMVESVKKIRFSDNQTVSIGVGINTGTMIIGNIGSSQRMEYTTIGDAVNLASRIQSMAKDNEILVGEGTYGLIKDEFECEYAGTYQVKGKSKPVVLYRIRRSL
ncbi:MAG: adenylate/guanylate cyclase domain-containing protein [Candidatus Omnitrophica bacterium]|nr:adenylate/guanylate cyclase domain-containing protein [Candidatus Omnitrophota bacterium]